LYQTEANMKALRLTVIGGGSVGMGVAASFAIGGAQVTLLVRAASMEALRTQGIRVTGVLGNQTIPPRLIYIDDADSANSSSLDCDVLVVATKAYQVADVLHSFADAHSIGSGPRSVLLLQNGWGSADEARAVMPANVGIFSSTMVTGFERRELSLVNVNVHAGPVRIGSLFGDNPEAIHTLLTAAEAGFLPVVFEPNIENAILTKFLLNNCLNGTGALIGSSYGELVEDPQIRGVLIRLADEAIRVLGATREYKSFDSGLHYVESCLIPMVVPKGRAHRSSMLQDIEAGRRTEIDYLNGAVLKMGRSCGIDTPINETVLSLIQAMERRAPSRLRHLR
jgi:2-dehydropantoate 2-reductase